MKRQYLLLIATVLALNACAKKEEHKYNIVSDARTSVRTEKGSPDNITSRGNLEGSGWDEYWYYYLGEIFTNPNTNSYYNTLMYHFKKSENVSEEKKDEGFLWLDTRIIYTHNMRIYVDGISRIMASPSYNPFATPSRKPEDKEFPVPLYLN